ncbi:hypothetical protein [Hyphomicrobium sp. CS1BSMeth3]|uniref:hypothetical protein n=1 Tax=Hyphomicrobium sp. CS1BSMeth3 TaxID=1892844 RepID=UPI000930D587|nr:hypothetical protein [Hyphomicrobium sp. CS1BSMeth3]
MSTCPGWLEIGLREAQRTPRGTTDGGTRSGRTPGFRPALRDVVAAKPPFRRLGAYMNGLKSRA